MSTTEESIVNAPCDNDIKAAIILKLTRGNTDNVKTSPAILRLIDCS